MRFLFIDRVLELTKNSHIVAVRQMSLSEEIFSAHFPGRPMMPASLLIESVAQAGTILLECSCAFEKKAFVGYVSDAKFRRAVVPGPEMRVELTIEQEAGDGALLRGTVEQEGRTCATMKLGMVTAPFEEFFPTEHKEGYRTVYRNWLAGAVLHGFGRHPLEED